MGARRSVLTDEKGLPFSVTLSGINTHDIKLLEVALDQIVVQRSKFSAKFTQNLCLDARYTGSKDKVGKRGYIACTRPRSEEKQELLWNPDFKARRWIVEIVHLFFDRFRKLPARFERKAANYLGLLHFACVAIVWHELIRIHI